MTNTNTDVGSLRGLELRLAVGIGKGFNVEFINGAWIASDPHGATIGSRFPNTMRCDTKEQAIAKLPAFESDLGALQSSGILVDLVKQSPHVELAFGYSNNELEYRAEVETLGPSFIEESNDLHEAICTSLCTRWLSLRRRGEKL